MSLEFTLNHAKPESVATDCVVVGAFADNRLTPSAQVTGGPVLHGPVVIVRERVDEEGEIHYAGLTAGDLWALQNLVGVLTPVAVAVRPPTEVN